MKRPESYNYLRGCEAVQKKAWDEAINYFNQDLQDSPRNGYSFSWLAHIRLRKMEYGPALTAVERALRYLPKKDKEYLFFAYNTRAEVYVNLGDTAKAIADYSEAIHVDPDVYRAYERRAYLYLQQGDYDLAATDYRRMTELDPGAKAAYMGLGWIANAQQRYEEAVSRFGYVTKLERGFAPAYAYRAEAYLGLEKWDEATDDILKALTFDWWDEKALELTASLDEPARTMLITKLKIKSAAASNEAEWPNLMGLMYSQKAEYDKAIPFFEQAIGIDADPSFYAALAFCYAAKGNYKRAISRMSTALDIDSTQTSFRADRARFYYESGDRARAIAELDKVIYLCPDDADNYYLRGWYKEQSKDWEGAVDDLSMSLVLKPEYTYSLLSRADAYMKMGYQEKAEADYRRIIDTEEQSNDYACAHYAYHALGQDDKAREVMDQLIATDTTRAGCYYDAACLYGRMGDKKLSLEYIRKALEKGFRRFAHMAADDDMDVIRDTEEYKALIKKFDVPDNTLPDEGDETKEGGHTVSEVPFTKEGGVCTVMCEVNGLPLHFVFDTGASTVSISMVEATFMMKNGYLTAADVIGNSNFMDANGNVSVGTVVNLKKVTFGGSELANVRASVVRNQKAPLLLGQSVLGRLGKIEIDNQRRVIRITH